MPPQNIAKNGPPTALPQGRLIALETSSRQGSVTLMEVGANEQKTLLTRELPPRERSAQTLVPVIQELLSEAGWAPNSLDCVAIAVGPGSFTGLRVGVTTAKTLAYVAGAALVAVNTLDALAEPYWPAKAPLWALLDAQRREVFAAYYEGTEEGSPRKKTEETLVQRLTQAEFFARLKPTDRAVAPHATLLGQHSQDQHSEDLSIDWTTAQPMADAVARLGTAKWQAGQLSDPFQLAPQYHRVSAAEENLPYFPTTQRPS